MTADGLPRITASVPKSKPAFWTRHDHYLEEWKSGMCWIKKATRGNIQTTLNLWMGLGVEDIYEPIEVAWGGLAGCSLCKVLRQLGVTGLAKKRSIHFPIEAAEKAKYNRLWIKRADLGYYCGASPGLTYLRVNGAQSESDNELVLERDQWKWGESLFRPETSIILSHLLIIYFEWMKGLAQH